jgi:hypothetical protein
MFHTKNIGAFAFIGLSHNDFLVFFVKENLSKILNLIEIRLNLDLKKVLYFCEVIPYFSVVNKYSVLVKR